ncbi:hypothetical protein ACJRO7_032326 [Eucalyptus globulus]|uniref:TIR domain-containing protein n=1 Tax=Eucalyptus globulus TaxID=34317 RepID=A0ABD3JTB8_EUCGL
MAWKDLPYLAAAAFAAIWFRLFSRGGDQARSMERSAKRRQGEQARSMERSAKRRRTGENDGTAGGASSTGASTEGQEVVASSGYDYEVFLSFRGPDTRAGFTDFLYTSLKDAGIHTFRDDEELRVGEKFAPELLQAIKQSKILIPIFSKGYASSPWCLKELVQMVECQENGRQKIIPIFYDVAPSEVRYQTGGYKEAFRSHENKKRYDEKTMQDWKDALNTVGAIHGWDLHNETNRREGEFAKEVTEKVFRELKKAHLLVSNRLVNVDNQVGKIMAMIGAQPTETRIIGIHGMGGIGKTTIAKIICDRLSSNFKDCCFLSNIRETSKVRGIACLQNQLISDILKVKQTDMNNEDQGIETIKKRLSNKRVLLVLDDVEKVNHIDAFVGNRDWFGKGSKIIITTRNEDILHVPNVDQTYEVECMDRNQSLHLFSKHAFRRDYPLDEDMVQSNKAICIAGGLPLALEVIGSLLCCIEKKKWDGKLKEWEKIPPEDVLSKLKISYDALRDHEQRIFLHIACHFIGHEKDVVIYYWDESRFFPKEAMDVLENRSLMKIDDDKKVWMHDQVRDLGREIVRRESNYKKEEQSRVWDPEEALGLLRKQKKKKKLEALCLRLDHQRPFAYEDFKRLPNLSFLEVCGSEGTFHAEDSLLWHASPSNVSPTNEDSHLLPELRWLSWHYIPPTFKITNFSMKDVVILDLSRSKITHKWQGWSHMKVMKNLKVLNLSYCVFLERTPNFSAQSNLEHLILSECHNLVEIDESICQLKHLVSLRVYRCWKLRRLPQVVCRGLATLQHCNSSDRLSDTIGNLESLTELDAYFTKIKQLPDSIGKWKNLKVVKIGIEIRKIPNSLWMIKSLEEIQVKGDWDSEVEVEIGDCIYENRCLRSLRLTYCGIYEVPRLPESLEILRLNEIYMDTFLDLSNLVNLKELKLRFGRRNDGGESGGPVQGYPMPRWIENLSKLESLSLWSDYLTNFPMDLSSILPRLKSLSLHGALLHCPLSLPSSLSRVSLGSVTTSPDISLLPQLWDLRFRWCPNLRCLPSLPSTLLSLKLKSECLTSLPMDMSSLLPLLWQLSLWGCPNLRSLPSLPSNLSKLELNGCKSLSSLGDLSNLEELSFVYINDCAISEIRCSDPLENLGHLWLSALPQLETLPSLCNFNELESLLVVRCGNLIEIQGELPQSLEELMICQCGSLKKLPDLSPLKGLRKVKIKCCGNLDVKAISSLCLEKSVEFGEEDYLFKKTPAEEWEEEDDESESEGEGDKYEEEDDE